MTVTRGTDRQDPGVVFVFQQKQNRFFKKSVYQMASILHKKLLMEKFENVSNEKNRKSLTMGWQADYAFSGTAQHSTAQHSTAQHSSLH